MPKYVLAYHGGSMPDTPAAQEQTMTAWVNWFTSLGAAVLDGGNPTGQSKTVKAGGITDGGGANPLSGYSLLEAANIDDAVAKAKGCPILAAGGSVEVAETIDM